jgi:TctA family transporter
MAHTKSVRRRKVTVCKKPKRAHSRRKRGGSGILVGVMKAARTALLPFLLYKAQKRTQKRHARRHGKKSHRGKKSRHGRTSHR